MPRWAVATALALMAGLAITDPAGAARLRGEFGYGYDNNKFREPDAVFMLASRAERRGNKYWQGADLVMEVVSEDDPERDLVTKRSEYAQAEISEYWIVNPSDRTILVLSLDADTGRYDEVGNYAPGDAARSSLLDGFCIEVDEVFAQD